jgi:nucleotide-binding universal stress UspA family protein
MYKKVLVPLDGSELAECVLPHVEVITASGAVENVTFIRVVKPFYPVGDYTGGTISTMDISAINKETRAAAENYLKQLTKKVEYPGVKVQWKVVEGNEAESIADYVKKNEIDLVIIATHGRSGLSRWVMGSVADRVLRSVCSPVLMVRAPGCITGF